MKDTERADSISIAAGTGLPEDLQQEGARRIALIALLAAIAWTGIRITNAWLEYSTGQTGFVRDDWAFVTMLGLSMTMFVIGRSRAAPPRLVLDLGLVYVTLVSLLLAFSEAGSPWLQTPMGGAPYLAFWLLLYAPLVPIRQDKMRLSLAISGLSGPVALALRDDNAMLSDILRISVIDGLAVVVAMTTSAVVNRLGHDIRRARELGSYRLTHKIGTGGMGEVWAAEHVHLARPAAIKLIRPSKLGRSADEARMLAQRFEREAQQTARLRSPHTVEIYDYGVTREGDFYYVMELLSGWGIDELVKQWGPVSPERAVPILVGVCKSLQEAHARGLVHRDIKPSNIIVCRYGTEYDFAKVLDFGLVKLPASDTDIRITREGMATGTPAYMAPEIALGRSRIRPTADIYALGCVMYYMLSGKRVFQRATDADTMLAHIELDPAPLSEAAEQPIPPALEALVMKCLQKQPSDRPRSALALVDSLEAVDTDLAAHWTQADARAWWKTHWREPTTPRVHEDALQSTLILTPDTKE